MESLTRSLNFELPHELHLDKYAQHILESSKAVVPAATPTALNASATTAAATISGSTSSDILQKIGATLLNSIQLKKFLKIDNSPVVSSTTGAHNMDMPDLPLNHVVIDSTGFDAVDELQKQLEYDKFMNEVWIGIVLTLILISMVFCICSCFLYHQFRTWKRNYRSTVAQSQDSEAAKLHPDVEDPVPEYALVSGLPSYEAALELLHKTPKSCLIVYPSVFNAFNKHEKTISDLPDRPQPPPQQHQQPQHHIVEMTTPLLPASAPTTPTATTCAPAVKAFAALPTYAEANSVLLPNVTLTAVSEKKTMQAKEKSPATAATTALAAAATATATDGLATSHRCEMLAHRN